MNDSAIENAQRAIDLALHQRSDTLDLHGLGLERLPPLPPELSTLRQLDLSGNRLQELPPEIGQFADLEELDAAGNRLPELTTEIRGLRALRTLDLSENRLSTLPTELAACTELQDLNLFGNQFTTLPEVVLRLFGLQWLDLALNRLEALPDLSGLTRLQVLDLAGNRLTELPPGLAELKELHVLDLSTNRLTFIDAQALPSSLEELFLDDNLLTEIPESLGAIGLLSVRGNPVDLPRDTVARTATGAPAGLRRTQVRGSYEAGKQHLKTPEQRFGFALDLVGKQAVTGSLKLYFKAFPGTPVSMRLKDGSHVDLARVGRKAALDFAERSDSVSLEFPPTTEPATVKDNCEFAERTLQRVPDAVLVETGETQQGHAETLAKSAEPDESDQAAPSPPPALAPKMSATRPEPAGATTLPAALPTIERDSVKDATSAADAEPVDTAVFCPPQVPRDSEFLVQVFLYPPGAAAEADAQARQADDAAERRGTYSLPLDLPRGTRLDLHLEMASLTVTEPDAVLVWRGRTTAAQFEVAVPADVAGTNAIGRIRFAVAGVPAGSLRFKVNLIAAGNLPGAADARKLRARRYRRAFVSYSSQDRAEVLRRVQAFNIAGLTVFQDILDLDPGERWEQALYREIDRCDVFLLFWSQAAAVSEWVGKEIDYALARKKGKEEHPPDIQPVPIEGPPIPAPPANLKGLHFNDALLAQIRTADTAPP